jgi:hypothetical protein
MSDCIERTEIKKFWKEVIFHFPILWHGPLRKYAVNSFSVAVCVLFAAGACLASRCVAMIRGVHMQTIRK